MLAGTDVETNEQSFRTAKYKPQTTKNQTHAGGRMPPFFDMSRLYGGGHSLIPLGSGEDGKSPLVRFEGSKRLPLGVIQNRMQQADSAIYGIRLHGMIVVDCDTDNAATAEYVEKRFGASSIQVKTPRGRHHYYRLDRATVPKRIREDGISIDFKSGANAYVAGPGSIRLDGGIYVPDVGILEDIGSLPLFSDTLPDVVVGNAPLISVGGRTFHIWEIARQLVEACDSKEGLFAELQSVRDWECASPENYSDERLSKTVEWIWQKRLDNELWGGAKSSVKTSHPRFELSDERKGRPLALCLLHVLRHNHSGRARNGQPFCIDRIAMAKAGVIQNWNQNHYRRAKNALLEAGLVKCIKTGNRFIGPSQYVLAHPTYHRGQGFILHTGGSSTPKTEGSI